MRTDDEDIQGYYLVKWITEPYTIQEDILMMGVEPPQTAFDREIICDALFWNPVPWGGELVYVYEKKGRYGNDKAQTSTGDRFDNDGDIRKEYAT